MGFAAFPAQFAEVLHRALCGDPALPRILDEEYVAAGETRP
jgi:hypothetical protein